MKKLFALLVLLAVLFTVICVNAGCRTVSKTKSSTVTVTDSTTTKSATYEKETVTSEKSSAPFTYNPGDLYGQVDPADTCDQVIETDQYKLTYKADKTSGKGNINVKGKDQQLQQPVDKTTTVREKGTEASQTTVKTQTTTTETKKATKQSWLLLTGLCLLGLLILIIIIKKINIWELIA
jgi:hypothetical protein